MKLRAVLTPHPGEMSRLSGLPISEVDKRRLCTAEAATEWGQVVLLKGAFSVVGSPDGKRASVPLPTRYWRPRARATCWRE